MKRIVIYIVAILFSINALAQKRNYIWCFGDSAGIDFNNLANPTTFQSGNDTHGSNCAIADTNGNLLFYALTSYLPLYQQGYVKTGAIFNKQHNVMQGGDSIVGLYVYNEVIILPFPSNDSLYYVFFAGVTPIYGLYYCVVNIYLNNGLGQVISKNNQLVPFAQVDCLNAIKHGNGRDWWLIFRRSDPDNGFPPNNEFHSYLISPSGITNYNIQFVGSMKTDNGGKLSFSKQGDMVVFNGYRGLIEKYNYDRCTGVISNPMTIHNENTVNFDTLWVSNEISSDSRRLYVSTGDAVSYLFQFDLTATNISDSRQSIWSTNYPINAGGDLKRGPDDKIYFACIYNSSLVAVYPYPDSMRNVYNENLGVINSPNILGAGCDFQPYSFYLGGKRTYWGIPNNPDYDMPALSGSPCDSLSVGIQQMQPNFTEAELMVSYVHEWQTAFINAQKLKGRSYALFVYDILGNVVFKETGRLTPPYFTKNLNCTAFAKGMYVVALTTEKEKLVKKFVKE